MKFENNKNKEKTKDSNRSHRVFDEKENINGKNKNRNNSDANNARPYSVAKKAAIS